MEGLRIVAAEITTIPLQFNVFGLLSQYLRAYLRLCVALRLGTI